MSNPTEKKEPAKASFSMDSFNTSSLSNTGVKVELSLPDGTETDKFLTVRGADSSKFKVARAKGNRELLDIKRKNSLSPDEKERRQEDVIRKMACALVAGWNFEEECTDENIYKFFKEAPAIQEQVDAIAAQRHHFFKKP